MELAKSNAEKSIDRDFRLEAVDLTTKRGIRAAQASTDLECHTIVVFRQSGPSELMEQRNLLGMGD